jgi:hypothetical protein
LKPSSRSLDAIRFDVSQTQLKEMKSTLEMDSENMRIGTIEGQYDTLSEKSGTIPSCFSILKPNPRNP